ATPRLSSGLYFVMSATSAPCQHVFHVADECILRQRAVSNPTRDRGGKFPNRRRDMQFLPDDPQAGLRDQAAQASDAHLLEQIIVLDLSSPRRLDERVLVRRFPQRPGRMPRKHAEGRKRDASAENQMQRNWNLQ